MADHPLIYRGYEIRRGPAYTADTRYQFEHRDWDGAPSNPGEGPADRRYGTGKDIADCMEQIDQQISERISQKHGRIVDISEGKKA